MNSPLSHDENMYVAAGKLINSNRLYSEFSYLQMPYLPIIYNTAFKGIPAGYYLLTARLVAVAFAFFCLFFLYRSVSIISATRFTAFLLILLFSCNMLFILSAAYAWNNIPALTFALAAFYFFVWRKEEKAGQGWVHFLSGLLLAISIGIKLFYVSLIPVFIVGCFLPLSGRSTPPQRSVKNLLPFLIGLLIGLLPILYFLLTDFENFWFNNFVYHHLNTEWKTMNGVTKGMSLNSKIAYLGHLFKKPSNILFPAVGIFFIAAFFISKENKSVPEKNRSKSILWLTILSFFALSCVILPVKPFQRQYFVPLIAFLVLFVAAVTSLIKKEDHRRAQVFLCVLVVIAIFFGTPRLFRYQSRFFKINQWTGVKVNQTAKEIKEELTGKKEGRIATLTPVYALESGLNIYPELSSGPFLYRMGDLLSDQERKSFIGVSPSSLEALLQSNPPVAILVGFEGDLDEPFIEYAQKNHYRKINKKFDGATLYVSSEN